MKKYLLTILLTAGLVSCSSRPDTTANASGNAAASKLTGGYRFDRNGWIYFHLEGPPERIGYQHGYLLADETKELLRVVGPFLEHTTNKN